MTHLPVLNNLPQFRRRRLPAWLRKRLPSGGAVLHTRQLIDGLNLATVCTDARCPNQPECWSRRTAVFMILGRHCTRHCHYCSVACGEPEPVAADEPARVAEAAAALGLRHVVITSVTRDDLPDEGAAQFADCVHAVRARLGQAVIEVLTPDFHARAECIETVLASGPAIFNHNIETVRRLTPVMRPQADYDRSLAVLRAGVDLRAAGRAVKFIKSGLIIGLGETDAEIAQTLADLRAAGCDILTIGQYLAPTDRSAPVARFYHPDEFDALAATARQMGFASVAAGPFVRSSYNAAEVYQQAAAEA